MFRMAVSLFLCVQYERPCQFHICFQSFFKSIKTLRIYFNEITLGCFFSFSCFLTSWFLDPIRGHLAAARRVLVPSDCDLTRPEKHAAAAARRSIQLATTHNGYVRAHTQTCPTVDVGGRDKRPFVWKKRRKKEKGKRPRRKRDRSGAGKIKRRNGGEERPSSSFHTHPLSAPVRRQRQIGIVPALPRKSCLSWLRASMHR